MKNTLTIAYISSRYEPEYGWFLESLRRQPGGKEVEVIIVWPWTKETNLTDGPGYIVNPKPSVWQGPHRLTKQDWWAASNARNTAICCCDTEWIGFVDDRCVLAPTWLEAVAAAMEGDYMVCGPYRKVSNIRLQEGSPFGYTWDVVPAFGVDSRVEYVNQHWAPHKWMVNPYECPGEWTYGCSLALPMKWALQINGFSEDMDGSSGEDYVFGLMIKNQGYPIRFDLRMEIIEDRTPDKLGPVMCRKDKGISPNDKSHWLLDKHRNLKRAPHQWDLRQLHAQRQAGRAWPITYWPNKDPYDGEPLAEMVC